MYAMWQGNESDDSERDVRKDGLVEKWKAQSGQLKSSGAAYILFLTRRDHNITWHEEPEIIGIFDSKAAAVARASTVECVYGTSDGAMRTFDWAMKDIFCDEGEYEDNREDPPDNGILIQLGGDDIGEGDFCRLSIKKLPVLSIPPLLDQKV